MKRLKPLLRKLGVLFVGSGILLLLLWQGGPWVAITALVTFLATFALSAWLVRGLYGESVGTWLRLHLSVLMGSVRGSHVIADGKTVLPADAKGPLMGPRLLVVRPENVVILERGSKMTRVSGPAVLTTQPFEYVRTIYDLRQKQETWTFHNVLTSDLLSATVKVSATYGIDMPARARTGDSPLANAEKAALQRLELLVPDWQRMVKDAVENAVREVASAREIEQLVPPKSTASLERRVVELANRRLRQLRLRVQGIILESVHPQAAVLDARASQWLTEVEVGTELSRTTNWSACLSALASAYKAAMDLGMPADSIQHETLCRSLQQIAKSLTIKLGSFPTLEDTSGESRR